MKYDDLFKLKTYSYSSTVKKIFKDCKEVQVMVKNKYFRNQHLDKIITKANETCFK